MIDKKVNKEWKMNKHINNKIKNNKELNVEHDYHRKCREVICPWCEHRFMWLEGRECFRVTIYKLVETGEYLDSTKCPKCDEKVVMLPHILKGAAPGFDERIKVVGGFICL